MYRLRAGAHADDAAQRDWGRLRDRWQYSHVGRAALAVLAPAWLVLGITG